MNLRTLVRADLWLAVSNTYEAGQYSHAILDAMHYLSTVLREKSGIDADGASLVGQALGGNTPRLRVNKLQTETERDIQRGLEQILRGLYQAIRNPRSHEQVEDSKNNADAIIYFVDYILSILAESRQPFTLSDFLPRVFDPDFVEQDRYAELLLAEIPPNKLSDTLIEIYRKKLEGNGSKLKYMVTAILKQLSSDQTDEFLAIVSDELKIAQDEPTIRSALQILPTSLWPGINEVARLRIENKLIETIKIGEEYANDRVVGTLGTWARAFLPHFTLRDRAAQVLLGKLEGDDLDDRRYVTHFFFTALPQVLTAQYQRRRCIQAISDAIRSGDAYVKGRLLQHLDSYPEQWQKEIIVSLQDLTDSESPEFYLADGTPLLGKQPPPLTEDELPF